MRTGLRPCAWGCAGPPIREQALARELAARDDEIARLVGALQGIGASPSPVLMLHPTGPVGTARAAMMLAEVTPALEAQTHDLRRDLQEVTVLRALQESAASKLREGLENAQAARTALSQAMADRTDLPRRFTEDPVQTALLVASTETLKGSPAG